MFDPFAAAARDGNEDTLASWERMSATVDSTLLVSVPPNTFLAYSEGPFGPDGPPQEVLDRSTDAVATIYRDTLERALASVTDATAVARYSYTPPSAYGKAGAIGAPWEIIEFLRDTLLSLEMAENLIRDTISAAVWESRHQLAAFFRRERVPANDRPYGLLGSTVIRDVCESHARRTFLKYKIGSASVYPASAPSPDYPVIGDLFTVVVPYQQGSIVYVVTSSLLLASLVRTDPSGSQAMNRDSWYAHFPEEERPTYPSISHK